MYSPENSNPVPHLDRLPAWHVARPELAAPTCQLFEPNHLRLMRDILLRKRTSLLDGAMYRDGEVVATISKSLVFGAQRKIKSLQSNANTGYLLCKKSA